MTNNKFLENYEKIKEEFFEKYIINVRNVEKQESEEIHSLFEDFVKSICDGDFELSYKICEKISINNIHMSIPYVVVTHEMAQLQKLMINRIDENSSDKMYTLHQINLRFEDIIAKNYLDQYIDSLIKKNERRVSSLTDIYEKNIVQYYKAHLIWLSSLAKNIVFQDNEFPELNHNLCTFGKWLNTEGKNAIQNNSKFSEIDKQHKNLHFVASKIKTLIEESEVEYHIVLSYLEKCEMISLSLGTELALVDNSLIKSEALKDPLTGALNRQKLTQIYTNQYEVAKATSNPFILAICDLDNFKHINDTYGHVCGDKLLCGFVNVVQKSLRNSDIIIRYGGEEFVLLLPALKSQQAQVVLEKVCKSFSEYKLEFAGQEVSTTVSIGMVEIDADNKEFDLYSLEDFVDQADKKLYRAKELGKNRVV